MPMSQNGESIASTASRISCQLFGCQSAGRPSVAEYWHIGAIAMRFFKGVWPSVYGEKS